MDAEDRWRENLLRAARAGQVPGPIVPRRWNPQAIASFVLAFFGLLVFSVPLAVWALVMIRRSPGRYRGKWLAVGALVWCLGWMLYRLLAAGLEGAV